MQVERGLRGRVVNNTSWVAGSWKMWEKESSERGLSLSFYKYSKVDI